VGLSYLLQPLAEFDMNTRLHNRLNSQKIRHEFVGIRDPYDTKSPLYKLQHRPLTVFPKIANSLSPKLQFPISPEFRRHQTRRRSCRTPHPVLLCSIFLDYSIMRPPELRRRRGNSARNHRSSGGGRSLKRKWTTSRRAAPRRLIFVEPGGQRCRHPRPDHNVVLVAR
jgi:hypothetical protein